MNEYTNEKRFVTVNHYGTSTSLKCINIGKHIFYFDSYFIKCFTVVWQPCMGKSKTQAPYDSISNLAMVTNWM